MNDKTDNNLAFWVEWVKLTKDQRYELLSYIHNSPAILAEIAIREMSKEEEGSIGAWAVYWIEDDETLLYVASNTRNADILTRIAEKLTPASFRLLFNMPSVLDMFIRDPKLLKSVVEDAGFAEGEDGFIDYYGRHQSVYVRYQVFNCVIGWVEDATNDERDKYLHALQNMMLREPNAEARSEMQAKLDDLLEDHI